MWSTPNDDRRSGRIRSSRSRSTIRCSTSRGGSAIVDVVQAKLLTPVGLRSLSQDHPDYKKAYDGDLRARDAAYHQGTVWAWLIGPFIDAWRKVHPGEDASRRFLDGFRAAHGAEPASARSRRSSTPSRRISRAAARRRRGAWRRFCGGAVLNPPPRGGRTGVPAPHVRGLTNHTSPERRGIDHLPDGDQQRRVLAQLRADAAREAHVSFILELREPCVDVAIEHANQRVIAEKVGQRRPAPRGIGTTFDGGFRCACARRAFHRGHVLDRPAIVRATRMMRSFSAGPRGATFRAPFRATAAARSGAAKSAGGCPERAPRERISSDVRVF